MDYSGPPSGARRRNCYDGTYYSESPSGAYSTSFACCSLGCLGFPLSSSATLSAPILRDDTAKCVVASLFVPHSRWILPDSGRPSVFRLLLKVGDLSAAEPLHTNLSLPAQNPGPGRVLRCRALTACPASWSASPRRVPPRPRFCWRTRRHGRLPAPKRRPPKARSSVAAPPPLPRTPPRSAPRARTPTRSTRCSEGLGSCIRGRSCSSDQGMVPLGSLAPNKLSLNVNPRLPTAL